MLKEEFRCITARMGSKEIAGSEEVYVEMIQNWKNENGERLI